MTPIAIRLNAQNFAALPPAIAQALLPRVSGAVEAIAIHTQKTWGERIRQARGIWWVERNRYVESLKWRMTGPYSAEVGTDEPVAELIEKGRPARDLKRMLNTSKKVRRTEKGRRFLVIPFRHNTPGSDALAPSMSPQAYKMAKGMKLTTITGETKRPSGQVMTLSPRFGMRPSSQQTPFASDIRTRGFNYYASGAWQTTRRVYDWGGRLTAKRLRAAGMDEDEVRRYAGMVRVKDTGKNRGNYLTFRIMAEGQSGWIVPAKPGLWLAREVANTMQPVAEAIMAEAAKLDAT